MAIFHFDLRTLSRSEGRSAVASAAYRAGARLYDSRVDKVYDYTRKQGVLHDKIIAPADAGAMDRQTLWAAAEAKENRKNSVVAREIILALPAEILPIARLELAQKFSLFLVDRYGVAVDLVIHKPGRGGDHRNHHAHLLFTTRRIGNGGALGEKTRELDAAKTGSVELKIMREQWANMANEALAAAGSAERIDQRSHLERAPERGGIVVPARAHLGPAATAAKRRGQRPRAARMNEEISRVRAELIDTTRALKSETALPLTSPSNHRRPPAPRSGHRHGPRP